MRGSGQCAVDRNLESVVRQQLLNICASNGERCRECARVHGFPVHQTDARLPYDMHLALIDCERVQVGKRFVHVESGDDVVEFTLLPNQPGCIHFARDFQVREWAGYDAIKARDPAVKRYRKVLGGLFALLCKKQRKQRQSIVQIARRKVNTQTFRRVFPTRWRWWTRC